MCLYMCVSMFVCVCMHAYMHTTVCVFMYIVQSLNYAITYAATD